MADIQLAPIPGPAVKVGTFDRQWMTQFTILSGKYLTCSLVPYDGTYILVEPVTRHDVDDIAAVPALAPLAASMTALSKGLADKTSEPTVITVNAPRPSAPIQCVALFPNPEDETKPIVFQIDDLLDLAAKDQDVAVAIDGLLQWVISKV